MASCEGHLFLKMPPFCRLDRIYPMQIKNKVVIITGASQGIGLATAKLLAGKGAKVVLAARSGYSLKKLEKELPGSLAIPTDMRSEADIKALITQTVEH